MRTSAVEKATRYSTTTDSVQSAFEFVMEYLAEAGERPEIVISPFDCDCDEHEGYDNLFEVSVATSTEEKA
jgi:hypothetical protein